MSFAIGDIVLVPIPFTNLESRKVRPAIIIGFGNHAADLFVVPVSSQAQNVDVPLHDWKQSGLNVACGIKSQIATIDSAIVIKVVGKVSAADKSAMEAAVRR